MRLIYEEHHEPALGRFKDAFVQDNVAQTIYVYDSQGQYLLIDATGLDALVPQHLSISGNTVTLSGGGGSVTLPLADTSTLVPNTRTVAGKPLSSNITLVPGDISGLQAALDLKGTSNFSGAYVDLTGKPTLFSGDFTDLTNKPATTSYLPAGGENGQILGYQSGSPVWGYSSNLVSQATTTSPGIIQLAGALGGTAAAPTVPGLATKVNTTTTVNGKALSGNITLAKADIGLTNVDNTSDADKPVSTAQQTALDGKFTQRTITGTTNQITVTNGDGVSGNPTLSLPQDIHTGANPTFAGATIGAATSTTDGAVYATNDFVGVYDTGTSTYYGFSGNINPPASNMVSWGGYYSGMGMKATTSDTSTAVFVLRKSNGSDIIKIYDNGTHIISGNIAPYANTTYSLGDSTHYWANTYSTKLYLNSTAYLDGGTAGVIALNGVVSLSNSGLMPTTDGSINLGSASLRWGNVYFKDTKITGGLNLSLTTKTVNYTITGSDITVLGDAASGQITFTLPNVSTYSGMVYNTKKIDSSGNAVVLASAGGALIDGQTTHSITTQYDSITVQSDGTNWHII